MTFDNYMDFKFDTDEQAEGQCHFCNENYQYTIEEFKTLFKNRFTKMGNFTIIRLE